MKHFLKIFLTVIIVIVALVVVFAIGLITWLSIKEYKPEPTLALEIKKSSDSGSVSEIENPDSKKDLTILSWNIGYAGLGKGSDFFMDGGKGVQSADRQTVEKYLSGIKEFISGQDADIVMLQEVDTDSARTYGINEADALASGNFVHALNYSCPFVPYPFPPIGKVHSGLLTTTGYEIEKADRIALPCPFSWPVSTANLKRCLLASYLPIEGSSKQLVIVNFHLEAYDDGEGKIAQTKMLREFIQNEYEKGNYVIAGGDFNQTFPGTLDIYPIMQSDYWVPGELDSDILPEGWSFAYDTSAPSCRLLNQPYDRADKNTQHYVLDGFILSPNIQLNSVENIDLLFENSDHNPVILNVSLKTP